MTDEGARYDRMAEGYARWWAPVLVPSAGALLDRLAPRVAAGAREVIDIGTGTGTLAFGAIERWPDVRVTGIDVSGEMLALADGLAEALAARDRDRFRSVVAPAAELPAADGAFDLAMSSFVLQLVPDRLAALREIRRVLRPGGSLGFVTWLTDPDRPRFPPDVEVDAVFEELGYGDEPPDDDDRDEDLPSAAVAMEELRAAGYVEVDAETAVLEHDFGVGGFIGFLTEFDQESTFAAMTRRERHRFLARLRERLMGLAPDDLVFRSSIVYATGTRPG